MPTRKIKNSRKNSRNTTKNNRKKRFFRKRGGSSKPDETLVKIRYMADTSKTYNKQGSNDKKSNYAGEIVLNVRNDIGDYFKKKINSVDSLIADIANKCGDPFCLTNNNPPLIAEQIIKIEDRYKKSKKE
jgi:hypothetical protein